MAGDGHGASSVKLLERSRVVHDLGVSNAGIARKKTCVCCVYRGSTDFRSQSIPDSPKAKPPSPWEETGVGFINSLTMSYFHTGTRTIIGAEAFHCPVRDGKEWDHLAMVIRLNLLLPSWIL